MHAAGDAAAGPSAGCRGALARRALCSGACVGGGGRGEPGGHLGTAVVAVHAVLLAVLLRVQVRAVVVLLRVVHVAVELVVAAAEAVRLVQALLWVYGD